MGVAITFKTVEFPSNIIFAVCGIAVDVNTRGEAYENVSVSGFVAPLPVSLYFVKLRSELKIELLLPVGFRRITFLSLSLCLSVRGEEHFTSTAFQLYVLTALLRMLFALP
jgi:hypothetical protein